MLYAMDVQVAHLYLCLLWLYGDKTQGGKRDGAGRIQGVGGD